MISEHYEKLRKKHNLPEFERLNSELHIADLEKEESLLFDIREKAEEKIDYLLELLHIIIQPDANSFADLYECGCFSEEERTTALEVYKQLMTVNRSIVEAEILAEEKANVEVIKLAYATLISVKQSLLPIIKRMKETWSRPTEKRELQRYLG